MRGRVVLDTNIVLSALLFRAGRVAWIRRAWQHQQLRPLASQDTVRELVRVLAYPKFKLSAEEQKDLLGDFLPYAEVVALSAPWPHLPDCRDEKDKMFPALAYVGDADALVTGDADLLVLRDRFPKTDLDSGRVGGAGKDLSRHNDAEQPPRFRKNRTA